jgi:hypothetical protein
VSDQITQAQADVRNDDMITQLFSDLKMSMNGLVSANEYRSVGSKVLASHGQTYKQQRSAASSSATHTVYRTSYKQVMSKAFELPPKK